MPTGILQFGDFHLDCDRFELRRNSVPLRLERKPLELLILLASSGGRLVKREEIARSLWSAEVFVDTEHGINTAIRKIRYALREDAERPCFLETVPGKGYRFTGVSAPPQATPASQDQPLPGSISVLPESSPHEPDSLPAPSTTSPFGDHLPALSTSRGRAVHPVWLVSLALVACLTAFAVLTFGRRVQGRKSPPPLNPAAVEAYQHAHYLWFSNHQENSGPYFLRATQLEPNYALAWAGLATYYGAQIVSGVLDPRQTIPLDDAAAHRANQLDDTLAEAHLALAGSDWVVNWDYPSALKELDRAIQLDPKLTEAHHLRAKLLAQQNRHEEALAEQRLAMQLNPFERPWALGQYLVIARRYDEAIAEARGRLEGTTNGRSWLVLAQAYSAKGMQNEAEEAREQSLALSGDTASAQAAHRAFLHGGHHEVMLWMLESLKAKSQIRYVSPYRFAAIYAEIGDKQRALDALEETVRQHSPMILDVQNDFMFDTLHAEPRYRALVQHVGLPPAW